MSIIDKTQSGEPGQGDHTTLVMLGQEVAALRQVSKGTIRLGTFWHAVGQGPVPVVYIGIEYYVLPMVMFYALLLFISVVRFRGMVARRALEAASS